MPESLGNPSKVDFFGMMPGELDSALKGMNWPVFRGNQVRDWTYKKTVGDPVGMSNLSKSDRDQLALNFSFATSSVTRRQDSEDGTNKLLLTWPNGTNAETVMIPAGNRRTACVSSQVGCPVGCKFCASGLEGVKGNLTAGQIVEQVFRLNEILKLKEERITNVVFMGMGEPMANYASVMKVVRILHDTRHFNIGARRMTISTVGVPGKIREMAGEDLPLNLAISLHAPNEVLRKQLIPWAEHFALQDILDAAMFYFEETGREVTLEYILLSGVNDGAQQARELAKLCKKIRANVNLIRYNEVSALPYKRPRSEDVLIFQEVLREAGVNAHVRKSRGRDIDAACGQLRRKEEHAAGKLVVLGGMKAV